MSDLQPRVFEHEFINDPGMELWASPSALASWSMYPTNGAINQDGVNQRTGLYCLQFLNGGGGNGEAVERYDFHWPAGQWMRYEIWAKASISRPLGLGLRFVNLTTVRELRSDLTWSAGNTGLYTLQAGVSTLWRRYQVRFRTEDTSGPADNYAISFQQYSGAGWASGDSLWVDSHSMRGPQSRPFVETGILNLVRSWPLYPAPRFT